MNGKSAVKRVKLLAGLSILTALVVGGVFLRCGEYPEVKEPMRWETAIEIPFNLTVRVNNTVSESVDNSTAEVIDEKVAEKEDDPDAEREKFTCKVPDTLVYSFFEYWFYDSLYSFGKNDPCVTTFLENANRRLESRGKEPLDWDNDIFPMLRDDLQNLKNDLDDILSDTPRKSTDSIPEFDTSAFKFLEKWEELKFTTPRPLTLHNPTTFGFTLYVLIFEKNDWLIRHIDDMTPERFRDFITRGTYRDGYPYSYYNIVSLSDTLSAGLKVHAGEIQQYDLPPELGDLMLGYILEGKPLAYAALFQFDKGVSAREIFETLKSGEEMVIDLGFGIKVNAKSNLDSLLTWEEEKKE